MDDFVNGKKNNNNINPLSRDKMGIIYLNSSRYVTLLEILSLKQKWVRVSPLII